MPAGIPIQFVDTEGGSWGLCWWPAVPRQGEMVRLDGEDDEDLYVVLSVEWSQDEAGAGAEVTVKRLAPDAYPVTPVAQKATEKRTECMESALKVIHTWATFDGGSTLDPEHVAEQCRKVLALPE